MEALMRVEPGLNRRVHQWEQKLQPLQQATTPVPPKAATWQAVSRAINGPPDPLLGQLLRRLRWYRYLEPAHKVTGSRCVVPVLAAGIHVATTFKH
ncbi:MAG: hypothetical protein CML06_00305, partial [Pseudomonadales bacterium]|nr:hypothetical protein [Pseudomonadales bacterium]